METSPSEEELSPWRVKPDPTADEAAAIAAAISLYVAEERSRDPEDEREAVDAWTLAGRVEQITGRQQRPPKHRISSKWVAANRMNR